MKDGLTDRRTIDGRKTMADTLLADTDGSSGDEDPGMSLPPGGQPPPQTPSSSLQLLPHNLQQKPETMARIVELTRGGKSARRINILLAQEKKLNSKGNLWTKEGGGDLMVIKRVLATQVGRLQDAWNHWRH
eukprot:scaffold18197_cov122-Isochrysis_galbana.AAC.4